MIKMGYEKQFDRLFKSFLIFGFVFIGGIYLFGKFNLFEKINQYPILILFLFLVLIAIFGKLFSGYFKFSRFFKESFSKEAVVDSKIRVPVNSDEQDEIVVAITELKHTLFLKYKYSIYFLVSIVFIFILIFLVLINSNNNLYFITLIGSVLIFAFYFFVEMTKRTIYRLNRKGISVEINALTTKSFSIIEWKDIVPYITKIKFSTEYLSVILFRKYISTKEEKFNPFIYLNVRPDPENIVIPVNNFTEGKAVVDYLKTILRESNRDVEVQV